MTLLILVFHLLNRGTTTRRDTPRNNQRGRNLQIPWAFRQTIDDKNNFRACIFLRIIHFMCTSSSTFIHICRICMLTVFTGSAKLHIRNFEGKVSEKVHNNIFCACPHKNKEKETNVNLITYPSIFLLATRGSSKCKSFLSICENLRRMFSR